MNPSEREEWIICLHCVLFLQPDPGSTTLVAGMTLQFQGDNGYDDWAYVCASVGDCKVFAIEHDTFKVRQDTYTRYLLYSPPGNRFEMLLLGIVI